MENTATCTCIDQGSLRYSNLHYQSSRARRVPNCRGSQQLEPALIKILYTLDYPNSRIHFLQNYLETWQLQHASKQYLTCGRGLTFQRAYITLTIADTDTIRGRGHVT